MPVQRNIKLSRRTLNVQRDCKVSIADILMSNLVEVGMFYQSIGELSYAKVLAYIARDIQEREFIPEPISG
jgi:hypothetical protein